MKNLFFDKNLEYLLEQKRLKQKEFAESLGLKQSTISNWVNGTSYPNFLLLIEIAEKLEIDIDSFIKKDISNNLNNSNELNEPKVVYQNNIDTEGVGILESLIKRVEQLEKKIEQLEKKQKS